MLLYPLSAGSWILDQSAGLKTCCLQVWDFLTGRLKKDLQYQAEDRFMMHDSAVIALAISRDSEMVASGSQDGKVKVLAYLLQSCKAPMSGCRSKHFQGLTPGRKFCCFATLLMWQRRWQDQEFWHPWLSAAAVACVVMNTSCLARHICHVSFEVGLHCCATRQPQCCNVKTSS